MNMTGTLMTSDGVEFSYDVMIRPSIGTQRVSFAITGGTIRNKAGFETPVHSRQMSFNALAKDGVPSSVQLRNLLICWIDRGEI